jgi:hypothetical protein
MSQSIRLKWSPLWSSLLIDKMHSSRYFDCHPVGIETWRCRGVHDTRKYNSVEWYAFTGITRTCIHIFYCSHLNLLGNNKNVSGNTIQHAKSAYWAIARLWIHLDQSTNPQISPIDNLHQTRQSSSNKGEEATYKKGCQVWEGKKQGLCSSAGGAEQCWRWRASGDMNVDCSFARKALSDMTMSFVVIV